jgi:hypothetical protein
LVEDLVGVLEVWRWWERSRAEREVEVAQEAERRCAAWQEWQSRQPRQMTGQVAEPPHPSSLRKPPWLEQSANEASQQAGEPPESSEPVHQLPVAGPRDNPGPWRNPDPFQLRVPFDLASETRKAAFAGIYADRRRREAEERQREAGQSAPNPASSPLEFADLERAAAEAARRFRERWGREAPEGYAAIFSLERTALEQVLGWSFEQWEEELARWRDACTPEWFKESWWPAPEEMGLTKPAHGRGRGRRPESGRIGLRARRREAIAETQKKYLEAYGRKLSEKEMHQLGEFPNRSSYRNYRYGRRQSPPMDRVLGLGDGPAWTPAQIHDFLHPSGTSGP